MYRELTPDNLRTMFTVPKDYKVDALLTFGTHPKSKAYPAFEKALTELGIPIQYETIKDAFFGEIKSIITPYGRLWFDVIYGGAYTSEVIHVVSLLGAKAIIHIGSFGALQPDLQSGDIILPQKAYGNESTTRMYARTNTEPFFCADEKLRAELSKTMEAGGIKVRDDYGAIISIQAMLAETREDVELWKKEGYAGVEMECAGLFAVAQHFGVPAATALYVTDNLVQNTLVTDNHYKETLSNRESARHRLYTASLKTLFNRMQK